ncbi:hypothetical protein [Streptomyces griseofuscus]|uniref:hypothetical protein n=1 Tax=Streptomyces griseofuscus TaxID=146922 RepID=UPI0033F52EE4
MPDQIENLAPSRRPRPRWIVPLAALVIAGIAGVGIAVALSSSGGKAKPFTLRGQFVLNAHATTATFDSPGDCIGYGGGGTGDIVPGAPVSVYDADGKVVAQGKLGAGELLDASSSVPCRFTVTVPDVPGGSKFYQVEVSNRGKVTVSEADAQAGRFAASLG